MTEASGTQGAPRADRPRENDLALAITGGSSFTRRLEQLGAAADAIDQATARFNFGKDIQRKMDEVQDRLEAATATKAEADRVLADAIEHARQKEADAARTLSDARGVKAEADRTLADAQKVRADAEMLRQHHEEKLADVQAREDEARAAAKRAREAEARAQEKHKELQAKLERLRQITLEAQS